MSVDPTEPETLDEILDAEERQNTEYREYAGADFGETPEADAAEQQRELLRLRDAPLAERGRDDADPADAAEQARVVDLGDEEYR